MRAPPLPSADVDAAGTIYVTWQDCRYRRDCVANGVVLATSRDGASLSTPRRVPVGSDPRVDYFLPAVAVASASAGRAARVAVLFHTLTSSSTANVMLATSPDGGATWTAPQRLNAQSIRL